MGVLLALLMVFNTLGGLIVVPALVKVLRPRFLIARNPERPSPLPEVGWTRYAQPQVGLAGTICVGWALHYSRGECA